jgi:P-type Cu+ transporter
MALHKDPLCGMMVDDAKAKWTSEHAGKAYYFCAAVCKQRFDANPARFAKA